MSEIILPGQDISDVDEEDLEEFGAPDVPSRAWLRSKVKRGELMRALAEMQQAVQLHYNEVKSNQEKHAQGITAVFSIIRDMGCELEAMMRYMDRLVEDPAQFRADYRKEFLKIRACLQFIDTLNGTGEHAAKPIWERIEVVRNWNALPETEKVTGANFGLDKYVREHPEEFTPEEKQGFIAEFKVSFTETIINVPKKEGENDGQAEYRDSSAVGEPGGSTGADEGLAKEA